MRRGCNLSPGERGAMRKDPCRRESKSWHLRVRDGRICNRIVLCERRDAKTFEIRGMIGQNNSIFQLNVSPSLGSPWHGRHFQVEDVTWSRIVTVLNVEAMSNCGGHVELWNFFPASFASLSNSSSPAFGEVDVLLQGLAGFLLFEVEFFLGQFLEILAFPLSISSRTSERC
jgi:hypothetical protein